MKEQKWLRCADPHKMLKFLQGKASDRKLRLFAVACCHRIERLLTDKRLLQGIEASERSADDPRLRESLQSVAAAVEQVYQETCEPYDPNRYSAAAAAVRALVGWQPLQTDYGTVQPETRTVGLTSDAVRRAEKSDRGAESREHQAQCHLLRDVFGNPFRPVALDPTCLTPTVTALARTIYNDRSFTDLPILGDALEDSGCHNEEILSHLRGPGPHCRGCWPLDLVLDKE
jgi:hypothetical protein